MPVTIITPFQFLKPFFTGFREALWHVEPHFRLELMPCLCRGSQISYLHPPLGNRNVIPRLSSAERGAISAASAR
jgi:hypothetical protein